jgi:hypothetical protein
MDGVTEKAQDTAENERHKEMYNTVNQKKDKTGSSNGGQERRREHRDQDSETKGAFKEELNRDAPYEPPQKETGERRV